MGVVGESMSLDPGQGRYPFGLVRAFVSFLLKMSFFGGYTPSPRDPKAPGTHPAVRN